MSYCRWSSDDFQCDVYTFAHADGHWQTYVAVNRTAPLPDDLPPDVDMLEDSDAWFVRHCAVMDHIAATDGVPIGGPHDGASFEDATAGDCARTLRMLRDAGYRVPQYAIDELEEEAASEVPA